MLKKTITYTDYDGNERSEEHYFNLSKAELIEMRFKENGGLDKYIEKIISEQDNSKLMGLFKDIVLKSYGQKSLDGKRFIKSEELTNEFIQTEAYSELFVELMDAEKCAEFINAIIPKDLLDESNNQAKTS